GAVLVVLAGAQPRIEQLAGDVGEIDFSGVLVLELFQTAARAAVAQALPFGVGHLFQRLGFPKESLLAGDWLGRCGHESDGFPDWLDIRPSRGCSAGGASGAACGCKKAWGGVSPDHQNGEPDHWFMGG